MSDKTRNVDWAWANQLATLPIFEAVALSLGYDLGTLPPVGFTYPDKPPIDLPEHAQRTFLAYEHARKGKIGPVERTSVRGEGFNADAEFSDGQSWEVEVHEFRRFCDVMKWAVPKEFLPTGYKDDVEPVGSIGVIKVPLTLAAIKENRAAYKLPSGAWTNEAATFLSDEVAKAKKSGYSIASVGEQAGLSRVALEGIVRRFANGRKRVSTAKL